LTDEGNAKDELMLKDGLHPNEDGLQVIIDYIRTHGYIEE
jgi:lysophospholipase L1-like esterase